MQFHYSHYDWWMFPVNRASGYGLTWTVYELNPHRDQTWQNWPFRLDKAAQSLQLFGFDDYFNYFKKYALNLMQRGESMTDNGRDLSWLFTHRSRSL